MIALVIALLVFQIQAENAEYTLKLVVATTQALADRVEQTVVNNPLETGPQDADGNIINDGWAPVSIEQYVEALMEEVNYIFRTVSSIKFNVVMTELVTNIDSEWGSLPDEKGDCGTALADWKILRPGFGDTFNAAMLLVDAKTSECGLGSSGSGWASDGMVVCNDGQFNVVADVGYGSAQIIAHEIGHNLGLGHVDDSGEVIMNSDPGSHWSETSLNQLAINIPLMTTSDEQACLGADVNECVALGVTEYKTFTRNELCNFRYPFDNEARVCDPPCGDDDLPFPRCGTTNSMSDCAQIKCNKKNLDPDNMGGGYCRIDNSPYLDRVECQPDGADDENSHVCYQGICTAVEDVPVLEPYTCAGGSATTNQTETIVSNQSPVVAPIYCLLALLLVLIKCV